MAWARALAPTSAEVALAIFPRLTLGERALHRFCAAFSEAHAADQGGRAVFYAVTFHPDAKLDLATPDRLVPFLRRSPHRTIQLVRASLLDAVRGGDVGKRFATTFDAAKALPPESRVSAGIGEANLDTVHREGPAKLAALLDGLRVAAERMTDKS